METRGKLGCAAIGLLLTFAGVFAALTKSRWWECLVFFFVWMSLFMAHDTGQMGEEVGARRTMFPLLAAMGLAWLTPLPTAYVWMAGIVYFICFILYLAIWHDGHTGVSGKHRYPATATEQQHTISTAASQHSQTVGPGSAKLLARVSGTNMLYVETITVTNASSDISRRELIIRVNGTVSTPHNASTLSVFALLYDVTDGGESPILCPSDDPDTQLEIYMGGGSLAVQAGATSFDSFIVDRIPLSSLVPPKKGQRTIRVDVHVAEPDCSNREQTLCDASANVIVTFTNTGYEEISDIIRNAEDAIARLGMTVALADGKLHTNESDVITSYFSERLRGQDDETERKSHLTQLLRETLARLRSTPNDATLIRSESIRHILAAGTSAAEAAYDLCVRIVAADDQVAPAEELVLRGLENDLKLPSEHVRRIRERHIRIAMYTSGPESQTDTLKALGMPPDLSRAAQLEWLQAEYEKWNRRATHNDKAVRQEAATRLKLIAEARALLMKADS